VSRIHDHVSLKVVHGRRMLVGYLLQ